MISRFEFVKGIDLVSKRRGHLENIKLKSLENCSKRQNWFSTGGIVRIRQFHLKSPAYIAQVSRLRFGQFICSLFSKWAACWWVYGEGWRFSVTWCFWMVKEIHQTREVFANDPLLNRSITSKFVTKTDFLWRFKMIKCVRRWCQKTWHLIRRNMFSEKC